MEYSNENEVLKNFSTDFVSHSKADKELKSIVGNALPQADELWRGISGHFDSLSQVLSEFIDNSISSVLENKSLSKTILLKIIQNEDGTFSISIEDTGKGIEKFDKVLQLGNREMQTSPLNEHGFGLKHALATADPTNKNWEIITRTKSDKSNNVIRRVSAPYQFKYKEEILEYNEWAGELNFNSGTYIKFTCSENLFFTLRKGFSSNGGFGKCMEYLCEDLGYIYSKLLLENGINITIVAPQIDYNYTIKPVLPKWIAYYKEYKPGVIEKDFGKGKLTVEYEFGEMEESNYYKFYKKNMSTQGVELRINGRLLEAGIFKEIWGKEKHPSYNHFLGVINLKSEDSSKLPVTRTSKNGIRADDKVLLNLYDWIIRTIPEPKERVTEAHHERELIKLLKDYKDTHIRALDKHVEDEFEVFKKLEGHVFADLYLYDGTDVVIYEAKKTNASVKDFYQLLMYWDGLVSDGKKPDEAILLASTFSDGVDYIIEEYNQREDTNGKNYNFSTKTWNEEGIVFN